MWFIAVLSLVLPIIGVTMGLYGVFKALSGTVSGWAWFAVGVLVLVVDLIIDERWSYWSTTSEPDLNQRGEQLVGQVVTVVEAIPPGGRGVVRAADTVWPAEGVDADAGAKVRITGCKGTVLTVETA